MTHECLLSSDDTQEPKTSKPLSYQIDLLSYYAKEALRARNNTEAIRLYERCK